jgi:hypothetical protein
VRIFSSAQSRIGGEEIADELTDSQIELLCEIEEHDPTTLTGDKGRGLERLLSEGYVKPMKSSPGPAYRLTGKGNAFLAKRGAGLHEG